MAKLHGGGEFSAQTVDLQKLRGLVAAVSSAAAQYDDWIGRFGHQSIAVAEGLADGLWTVTGNLRHELAILRRRYEDASSVDTGIFVVLKSLEEVAQRIVRAIPNDGTISNDQPLFIRLSEKVEPVLMGELTLAQLRLMLDLLTLWSGLWTADDAKPSENFTEPTMQQGPPRLKPQYKRALDLIKGLEKPTKGAVIANKLEITVETFYSHYVPALKPHGLRSKGGGYSVESS